MKKTLLVILGLCILAVPALFAQAYTASIAPLRLTMVDSFEWSNGYQGNVLPRNLLNGHRIAPGETYTLQMKFTASRDLEEVLEVCLVDTTERAKWWTELSNYAEVSPSAGQVIRAGREYTITVTFTTTARSTAASPAANAIVFTTKGEGKPGPMNGTTPGIKGSGVKGNFNLNFTEFTLTRN